MDFATLSFYAFATMAIAAAIGVISMKNPVHAALLLVLTFFSVACTWIIAGAEFLGIALILVYVGAVMVLFLFVVMMLDIDVAPLREGFVRYLPIGAIVAVAMLFEICMLIGVKVLVQTPLAADAAASANIPNTTWLARALFTEFLLPFEVAAVILTIAVVAAVMLTAAPPHGREAPGSVGAGARAFRRPTAHRQDGCREARCPGRHGGDAAMMTLSLGHFLVLGAALFCISLAGIFLNRKNVIVLLMSIELMLLAVNINFVAFSRELGDAAGQVFVFFILTVAAAEAAIGLAILVTLFRNRRTINVAEIDTLKG
jgi:NADH-quinone oxidoreductase subunit J